MQRKVGAVIQQFARFFGPNCLLVDRPCTSRSAGASVNAALCLQRAEWTGGKCRAIIIGKAPGVCLSVRVARYEGFVLMTVVIGAFSVNS